jgi:hypothetical protein
MVTLSRCYVLSERIVQNGKQRLALELGQCLQTADKNCLSGYLPSLLIERLRVHGGHPHAPSTHVLVGKAPGNTLVHE